MASENSAIGMQFIQNDVTQILEQPHPLGVVWQDAGVQHVWIRQDDMATLSNRLARVLRRVAIVGEHSKAVFEPGGQVMQLSKLVLGQCLGWEQVKGASVWVLQHGIQYRKVVAKCFTGCCRRYDDNILAAVHQLRSGSLVRIELSDSLSHVSLNQFPSHPVRHGSKFRFASWDLPQAREYFVCAVTRNQRS